MARATRAGILFFATALLPATATSDPVDLEIAAVDGLVLRATYFASAQPGPGVLLLHQCNRDRHAWSDLATKLADAGLHALTMDFRGFGESTNADVRDFHEQRADLWPAFDDDVERAVAFLQSMPGVDGRRLGVLGASCGGSQALLTSLRHPEVQAVAFLSSSLPWIDETDVALFEANPGVAVLGVAAEGDEGSAAVARRAFSKSNHASSKLVLFKGNAHGVPLFELDPELPAQITAWFAAVLRGE